MTKLLGENVEEEEVKARQELANAKSQEKRNNVLKSKLPDIDVTALGQQLSSQNGAKDATKKAANVVTNKLPGPLKGLAKGFADKMINSKFNNLKNGKETSFSLGSKGVLSSKKKGLGSLGKIINRDMI